MKRPSEYDIESHETFFNSEKAKTFFGIILGKDEDPKELLDAFYNAYIRDSSDPYRMTKELEYYGIEGDIDVVELCDQYDNVITNTVRQLVKQWVIDNDIKCHVKLGDRVKYINGKKIHEGIVDDIREKEATIILCCENEGHVKTGNGTHGYVVNYEDIIIE